VYAAGGALQLRDVTVTGHEYALLTGDEARIDVRGLHSVGADPAGNGLVKSKGVLEEVRIEAAGQLAAVQVLASEVRFRALEIQGGRASGLVARSAQLTLEGATVSALRSADSAEGDAFQIRGGRATLSGIRIQDCSGIGVLAAEGADVTLARSTVSGAGVAGLSVETEARLAVSDVSVERTQGPAVLVSERGTARLRAMTARANRDGPVWAECNQGVEVEIDGWTGDATPPRAPCIRNRSAVSSPR